MAKILLILMLLSSCEVWSSTLIKYIEVEDKAIIFSECSENVDNFKKNLYLDSYKQSFGYSLIQILRLLEGQPYSVIKNLNKYNFQSPILYNFLSNNDIQNQISKCFNNDLNKYEFFKRVIIAQDFSAKVGSIVLIYYILRGGAGLTKSFMDKIMKMIFNKYPMFKNRLLPLLNSPKAKYFGYTVVGGFLSHFMYKSYDTTKKQMVEEEKDLEQQMEKSESIFLGGINEVKNSVNHIIDKENTKRKYFNEAYNRLIIFLENTPPSEEDVKSICLLIYEEEQEKCDKVMDLVDPVEVSASDKVFVEEQYFNSQVFQ